MEISDDEKLFIKLRDCFTAGYTLPQFCIDNGIKKPLFVSEEKFFPFAWEIYVQFKYDKRMTAQFSLFDIPTGKINFSVYNVLAKMNYKNFAEINLADFDSIILLTTKEVDITDKVISFVKLVDYFTQKTYVEIPLLNFLQRYPKVKLFVTNFPYAVSKNKGFQEFNSTLRNYRPLQKDLIESQRKGIIMPTTFDRLGYTNSQVISLLKDTRSKKSLDATTIMFDDDDPLIQIKHGKRLTAYQPKKFFNRIYIFGTCHHFGTNAPFDKTIASYLQKMLNEANLPYRVENEGQCYYGRYQDIFYNLNKINYAPGDIIFIYIGNAETNNLPFCNLEDVFDPPNDFREIFCRKGHVNELGYKLLAERYFKFLTENNFFRDIEFNYPLPPPPYHRYGIPSWTEKGGIESFHNEDLEAYKQRLREKKIPIGALVMNCNPFTLGHRYLVEYAAAKVAKLYIFVVEEDKSEFPFADRIELVRQGVKDFSNVEVLPSGKFIISQTTFSGYFNKASLQDVVVDSSEDVEIFGREIAPTLGITVRFAGEEPKDNVTRQYNETMKSILPRYGVEFCEIPRKEFSGEPISASTVREALKVGDFDKIKNLVPETTLKYLRKRYALSQNIARVDIRLIPATPDGDFQILSLSDDGAYMGRAGWLPKNYIGYFIQSNSGELEIIAKATVAGQVSLALRGKDVHDPKDKTKRIPHWVDYTKLTVNEQIILNTLTPAWHNKPYIYTIDAKANEEIKIHVEWLPHDKKYVEWLSHEENL